MKTYLLAAAVLLLVLSAPLIAQGGQTRYTPEVKASVVPATTGDAAPPFTDAAKKDAELLSAHAQLVAAMKEISDLKVSVGSCQAVLGPLQLDQNRQALQAEQAALVADYEKTNPGFTLDGKTGLPAKKPVAAPAPKPPKL